MKGRVSEQTVGLVFGAFAGFVHLVWSVVVYLGFGQTWLDFVFGLHFLSDPFTVGSFEVGKALTLVVFASIAGFVGGVVLAKVWNLVIAKSK